MSDYLFTRLAKFVVERDYGDLEPDEVHEIKRAVVDYLGCALGAWRIGVGRELVASLVRLGGTQEATIWGSGAMVPAHHAALAVGAVTSHLELDTHADMIPAAFAAAESSTSSGRALIVALSVALRVAGAMKQLFAAEIEAHGLHWPAQVGTFSATVAVCKLLNMGMEQVGAALSLSGCLSPVAPFEAFTQGAGVKDLYGGWCGLIGILACRLSAVGFGGPPNLVEGNRGLGRTWLHAAPSPDAIEAALAVLSSQSAPALQFKRFAACASAQPTLSAIELLLERYPGMDPSAIERVQISTYEYAVELSEACSTLTPVSARVNLPHLAAAFLLDGRAGPEQVESPRFADPHLQSLTDRVSVSVFPNTFADLRSRTRPSSVTIVLRDGTNLHAEVSEARWAQSRSVSDHDIECKFRELVGGALEPAQRENLLQMLWNLESFTDVSQIVHQTIVHE